MCGCVVVVVSGEEEEVRTVLYMVSRISRRLVDPLPLSFKPGPSGTESGKGNMSTQRNTTQQHHSTLTQRQQQPQQPQQRGLRTYPSEIRA